MGEITKRTLKLDVQMAFGERHDSLVLLGIVALVLSIALPIIGRLGWSLLHVIAGIGISIAALVLTGAVFSIIAWLITRFIERVIYRKK